MKQRFLKSIIISSGIILILWGCSLKEDSETPLASIGPGKIYLHEFNKEYDKIINTYENPLSAQEARRIHPPGQLLEQLVEIRLIAIGAEELDISVSENEVTREIKNLRLDFTDKNFNEMLKQRHISYSLWIEQLKHQIIINKILQWAQDNNDIEITEKEIEQYYNIHIKEFRQPLRVKVRQITVPDEDTARSVYQRLKNGEDFAKLAHNYSTSPDAAQGGDIGYFGKGDLPIEFEEVVFKLKPGIISKVINSSYGSHIFRVEDIQPARDLSLGEAKSIIKSKLVEERKDVWYQNWVKQLKEKFPVSINYSLLEQEEITK